MATISKTVAIIGILAAVVALAAPPEVTAQDLPQPPAEVIDLATPAGDASPSNRVPPTPGAFEINDFDPTSSGWDRLDYCDRCPAVTESTGTWFRRGWWYTEADAVVLTRTWDRRDLLLALDSSTASPGFPGLGRILHLDKTTPGGAGSVRFTLGRFLFRDIHNRDHTTEFTVFGGGEFTHNCTLTPNDPNSVQVNSALDQLSDASFDGANSTQVQSDSRFNSFEWNYVARERMRKDRMEMQPTGQWIRRASPGFTRFFLGGMRYFDLTENINWTASDIIDASPATPFTGENGQYLIRTSNDMFGFQIGGGITYESDRWSLTFSSKSAVMMNDAIGRKSLVFTDPVTGVARTDVGFSNSSRQGTLPFLFQFGMLGRYYLRPNVAVRGGYELLYLTSTALAPHQIDFNPDTGKLSITGDTFYHGITMGVECFW